MLQSRHSKYYQTYMVLISIFIYMVSANDAVSYRKPDNQPFVERVSGLLPSNNNITSKQDKSSSTELHQADKLATLENDLMMLALSRLVSRKQLPRNNRNEKEQDIVPDCTPIEVQALEQYLTGSDMQSDIDERDVAILAKCLFGGPNKAVSGASKLEQPVEYPDTSSTLTRALVTALKKRDPYYMQPRGQFKKDASKRLGTSSNNPIDSRLSKRSIHDSDENSINNGVKESQSTSIENYLGMVRSESDRDEDDLNSAGRSSVTEDSKGRAIADESPLTNESFQRLNLRNKIHLSQAILERLSQIFAKQDGNHPHDPSQLIRIRHEKRSYGSKLDRNTENFLRFAQEKESLARSWEILRSQILAEIVGKLAVKRQEPNISMVDPLGVLRNRVLYDMLSRSRDREYQIGLNQELIGEVG